MKKLFDYAQCLKEQGFVQAVIGDDCQIEHISYTSKNVLPNTLFICKGEGFKEEYLKSAVKGGACAYMSQVKYDVDIPCILVNDVLTAMSALAAFHYDYPQNQLKLIAVTGTKGKSTTSYYIKAVLDNWLLSKNEQPCALISSIDTDDGVEHFESHITTPEGLDLHRHLRNAVDSSRKYCIVESSSQALKYGRLYGLCFEAGLFLNISEDHISPVEHKDLEDYFTSKLKIFEKSKYCAYNINSDMADRIKDAAVKNACEYSSFGISENADLCGYDLENTGLKLHFKAKCSEFDAPFELSMPGKFNVENALGAISVALRLGIPLKNIQDGLKDAKASGRMEVFANGDHSKIVIVDYAHNFLSMSKLYEAVREEYKGREITTVFGCPGGKAVTRRRDLGMVAGINSDRIYLTEEDCDCESVRSISQDIGQYAERNCDNVFYIDDRTEAIRRAIFESSSNAVILLTAKGRETRQKRNHEYVEITSDVDLAQAFLALYDMGKRIHSYV